MQRILAADGPGTTATLRRGLTREGCALDMAADVAASGDCGETLPPWSSST